MKISQSAPLAGLTPAPSSATSELPRQYDLIRVVIFDATVITSGSLTYLVGCCWGLRQILKPTPNIISYVVDVGANHPQAKPFCMNPRAPPQPHTEALTVRLVDVVTLG